MTIEHVSDTARWVAVYRAMESERPDALFNDPFARRLAGEKGAEIVNTMKDGRSMAWAMIVRTQVFDEIIMGELRTDGIDLVLNLAAGLDARPWRLDLLPTLKWIDVDLPDILRYKLGTLADAKPRCAYEAIEADLTDAAVRRELFASIAARSRRMLVVTEGLLIYLTDADVTALATDLHAQPTIVRWVIDLASPRLLKMMSKSWGSAVAKGNAPFRFAPASGTDFFRQLGWEERAFHSTMEESQRLHREMKGAAIFRFIGRFYPARMREEFRRMSGTVVLER
ncbi:MAG: class I SAM-dependent methyltransferase, partial [Gemmatimonadota bacterium]|nr:class I SAM-dependent methyltransferase [Gemmatimonadota bacterium]